MDDDVFAWDTSLEMIDIPSRLKELKSDYTENFLFYGTSLTCLSYLGSTDFSSAYVFDSGNNPEIHVSDSLYPKGKQFGQRDVIRDGQTCGVSNEPLIPRKPSKKKKCICTKLAFKYFPKITRLFVFLVHSWIKFNYNKIHI